MFINRETAEETADDLHVELEDARTTYEAAVESVQEGADQRRAVVRHRLAALEAEDQSLDLLQRSISA